MVVSSKQKPKLFNHSSARTGRFLSTTISLEWQKFPLVGGPVHAKTRFPRSRAKILSIVLYFEVQVRGSDVIG